MSDELFTSDGKRKYLTPEERERFLGAAAAHHRGEVHTFCIVLGYTGCRISEALELTADGVDFSAKAINLPYSQAARQGALPLDSGAG